MNYWKVNYFFMFGVVMKIIFGVIMKNKLENTF